ncbi:MAG TPA: hypothetical protein VFW92_04695 [Candidatus Limnocylindrales bacterium]|nr:hypothetical protein [Candidatus Limnocylindrales bacterium]
MSARPDPNLFHLGRTRRRSGPAVVLATVAMLGVALGGGSIAFAAGPGNNGLGTPNDGSTSAVMVGGSVTAAGGSATMNTNATMSCTSNDSVLGFSGSFTLDKTVDSGSRFVVYLVPNNGSDANPSTNVAANSATVTVSAPDNLSGKTISFSIPITSAFTESSGGILIVFAVNSDSITAISSSKSNSLNCSEAATPTPTVAPTPTPTVAPTPTPTVAPTPTPTVAPTPTPTVAPTPTPTVAPTPTPTIAPTPTPTVAPTPTPTIAPTPTLPNTEGSPTPTPSGTVVPATSTPAPSGTVEPATPTPTAGHTLPATDTTGSGGPSGPGSWFPLLLLGLACLAAGIVLLRPAPAPRR